MFYVYEWYIKSTNEIIYVGKGTKNRYKVRKHNKFFDYMVKNFECESRIIRTFDNEKEAFEYEYDRINELKSTGQCVCNINKGGSGGTTDWWTDELRDRYSRQNVMKSERQRQRMREKNPMQNKEIARKTNSQKNRPVIINGMRYESVKKVMDTYNVCYEVVANWCRKGINSQGEVCRYEDSEQIEFSDKRYNKGGCKPMSYMGKVYESSVDCAKDQNISLSTLYSHLKRGFDLKGNPCRYLDDHREIQFENPFKGKPATPVIVNGVKYKSIEEASKTLNVAKTTLYAYLQGRRKGAKYICAYDNQQPSRGNTDNSTAEGSTTNE